jgi:hypothetical protein
MAQLMRYGGRQMERLCEDMTGAEAGMWKAGELQDNIEQLIINFGDNISSSDDSADSYEGRVARMMPVISKTWNLVFQTKGKQ